MTDTEATALPRGSRARRRSRVHAFFGSRPVRWLLFTVLAIAFVAASASAIERLAYRGEVLPGVDLADRDVAGLDEAAALADVQALAATLETTPLEARAADVTLQLDPTAVGLDVDATASVRAAREAGRSRNPVEAVVGTFARRFRDEPVELVVTWDDAALDKAIQQWAAQVDVPPVDGGLTFDGASVTEVPPEPGRVVDRDATRELLEGALLDPSRAPIELPFEPEQAVIDEAEVSRAAEEARALLADPVTVFIGEGTFPIEPEVLGGTLRTEVVDDHLELTIEPLALHAALGPETIFVESLPVDAGFAVQPDNSVTVVPSIPGRRIDIGQVGNEILTGQRAVTASFVEQQPEHDTAWAEALNITELVSSFTTNHPAGQSRVVNIHRAADILQNQIVEPGGTFSLNDAIGPRTPERGFVEAGVYYETFTEDYGGGVSQIATTFWNAVFYGGYEDVSHTPHSLYFSRYPKGREATINYPTLDLKFRNDSSSGILIRTAYTDTSITISFYGNKEGRIVREEGPTVLEEFPAGVEFVESIFLPPGETETEPGYDGFSVEYYRIIERPGQAPERQRFTWRYDTLDEKIYVGVEPKPPADDGAA